MSFERLISGVGIADPPYNVTKSETINGAKKIIWQCPIYSAWKSMIDRCYNEKCISKRPSYDKVIVCEEWLRFSNFYEWFSPKYVRGLSLDKDLKYRNCKLYSPDTCLLVNDAVNGFLVGMSLPRGKYPKGVRKGNKRNMFEAQINNGEGSKTIGSFTTEMEAHKAWQLAKAKRALELASQQTNNEVRLSLISLANKLNDDANKGKETKCEENYG